MVHAYVMNMGGYFLDCSEVGFTGVDISKILSASSSGLSVTAVDYSGVHFSGNRVPKLPGQEYSPNTTGQRLRAVQLSP